MPKSDRFIVVHVIPKITSIPTPRGDLIPISEHDPNVVAMSVQEMQEELKEVFIPFKEFCKTRRVETLILEYDNPTAALLRYISENGISCLVLGSCSLNFLTRKLKGPGVPTNILLQAANTCDIYVVYKDRVTIKAGSCSFDEEARYAHIETLHKQIKEKGPVFLMKKFPGFVPPLWNLKYVRHLKHQQYHIIATEILKLSQKCTPYHVLMEIG